jgi:hypothetical protein
MKNITVTVSDELYRHARLCAVHRDTTVSELVRQLLSGQEPNPGRRARTIQSPPAADDTTLYAQLIRAELREAGEVSGKINTPHPPLFPCETVRL